MNYTTTVEGSIAIYQCDTGLIPVGVVTAICMESGEWAPDPANAGCRLPGEWLHLHRIGHIFIGPSFNQESKSIKADFSTVPFTMLKFNFTAMHMASSSLVPAHAQEPGNNAISYP